MYIYVYKLDRTASISITTFALYKTLVFSVDILMV